MKTNITILVLLFFCSCTHKPTDTGGEPSVNFMQVEIEENGANNAERIKTIRFIVFTGLSSDPVAEVNRLYSEEDFVAEQLSGEKAASRVRIVLEVGRRSGRANDKLVVAIVNEPATMTSALNDVTAPGQLETLELAMSDFVTNDHLALLPDVPIPMSGAVWTGSDDIYPSVEQAADNTVEIGLSRAVARVDVYMNASAADGIRIGAGSTVTLDNTCDKSYYIRHVDDMEHVLGNIQTASPDDLTHRSWTMAGGQKDIPHGEAVHICSFYTPERYCVSDKLKLRVGIVTSEGAPRSGTFTLDRAVENATQIEKPIDVIRRNNIYRVTATIGENGITAMVNDWADERIITDL